MNSNVYASHLLVVLAQHCKNLRTNGAILAHNRVIDHQRGHHHIVAMDWIGNSGYLYMLANVDGIYFAKKISVMRLPQSLNDISSFKPTLQAFFRYQRFMTQLGQKSLSMMHARENMESLCGVIDLQSEASPAPPKHPIFFTPQNHRTKRTKIQHR
ncbi:hypothetical protein BDB00DRAFT_115527 [Zychaea mexicana]|uniref:uncharacterized protein n=1 Tax=Zychaea mexicana TaxID=64656 RepID=UPI0022FE2814|nr:uncharacterized protein BDB00DRAFT_115527 [Zychaea mexicana]KAI9484684.1 hypothetical protein BDB00DRAFT_115527 [Zychaea mexicana]